MGSNDMPDCHGLPRMRPIFIFIRRFIGSAHTRSIRASNSQDLRLFVCSVFSSCLFSRSIQAQDRSRGSLAFSGTNRVFQFFPVTFSTPPALPVPVLTISPLRFHTSCVSYDDENYFSLDKLICLVWLTVLFDISRYSRTPIIRPNVGWRGLDNRKVG